MPNNSGEGGGNGNGVDYATLPLPPPPPDEEHPHREGKPYEDYTWAERRAKLYELIDEAGHPRNLERTQQQLAAKFGVSQGTISKDIKRLREYEAERAGKGSTAETQFVLRKAVRELLAEGKFKEAAQMQLEYEDWLMDTGRKEREPDRADVDLSVNPSDAYLASLQERQDREQRGPGDD